MAGIDRASVLGTVARHLADILETDASGITEV